MGTTFSRVAGMTADQRAALVDQFEKAARIATAEPVALVGIGCRFPGAVVGPEGYWAFLANGGDAISEVPADRWDADVFYDPDPFAPGRMASKWGGFLPDVAGFDADFFGITPREAKQWIRSSECCWRWPGKHSSMLVSRRIASAEPVPR